MNRAVFAIAAVTLVLRFAAADLTSQAKRAMEDGYRKMNDLYKKADAEGLGKLFSPECTFKTGDEPMVLKTPRFIEATKAMFGTRTILVSQTKIIAIQPVEGGFVARVDWSATTVLKSSSPATKASPATKIQAAQTIFDTWKKLDGKWLIVKRLSAK